MKKRDFQQVKTKPASELKRNAADLRDKLWSLKTDLAAGKVKNVKDIKKIKKDIARLLTLVNQNDGAKN